MSPILSDQVKCFSPFLARQPFQRHFPVIVLSDIHFARKDSHPKYVYEFLLNHTCDTLVFLGDTHEGYDEELTAPGEMHQRVWDLVAARKEQGMRTVDCPGNHDSYKRKTTILGNKVFGTEYRPDLILESAQERTFLFHGDALDGKIALRYDKAAYTAAKNIRLGNKSLLDLRNIIQDFTHKVRSGAEIKTNKIGIESAAAALARERNCTRVLSGHTHRPSSFVPIQGDAEILYGNTGSWVGNSATAMVMHEGGRWELIDWAKSRQNLFKGKPAGTEQHQLASVFREQTRQEFLWQRAQHRIFTNESLVFSLHDTMEELNKVGHKLRHAFDRAKDEISLATEEVAFIEKQADKVPLSKTGHVLSLVA